MRKSLILMALLCASAQGENIDWPAYGGSAGGGHYSSAQQITVDNVEELMPDQTHAFGNRQMHLSFMSDKWIMKILKKNPHITTYKELEEINKQEQDRYLDRRF